jgi:hypothetical protein
MPVITGLTVVVTTSTRDNADCDGSFQLQVVKTGGDELFDFGAAIQAQHAHDQLERGRTDQYFFDLTNLPMGPVDTDDANFQVILRALGTDFWLPSSIFVLGHGAGGGVLVGFHPAWLEDGGWFSTAASETSDPPGAKQQVISGTTIAT